MLALGTSCYGSTMPMSNPFRFSIPSSSGREELKFAFDTSPAPSIQIACFASFWDRAQGFTPGTAVLPDFEWATHQTPLSMASLRSLATNLETWLMTQEPFELTLSTSIGQSCSIAVGPTDTFICSKRRPVVTLRVALMPEFTVTTAFVVDQSCLRICLQELKHALRVCAQKTSHEDIHF